MKKGACVYVEKCSKADCRAGDCLSGALCDCDAWFEGGAGSVCAAEGLGKFYFYSYEGRNPGDWV